MHSPVDIPFKSFIHIDRNSSTPIYLQIANQIIQAIATGKLTPKTKILGSRALSELLSVHRNTISAAFDELFAQGWVEILPNKGTFVSSQIPTQYDNASNTKRPYPTETGYHFNKSILLDSPFEHTNCEYILNDGSPDIRLTHLEDQSRFYSSNMKRKINRSKMGYYNQEGSEYFKEQMLHYLQSSRGLQIEKSNLLISRSIEMSLFIISEILLSEGDIIVVAELSYFAANMIFQKSGSKIKTVPLEDDGINVDALENLCQQQPIRMVYITPQHHYPTTANLSAKKRMQIQQLSLRFGFIIVEDDHDYDFQYDRQPLLPLATTDQKGMVIYVSSFGKSLAPGFRTGFIVAPNNLMVEMKKLLGIIDRQGDILMEQALGEMLEEGVIHRHLKKSIKIYKHRRDFMANLLTEELGSLIDFHVPNGGLAFWIKWKKEINLLRLSLQAAKNNLFIPKTLLYQQKDMQAMRIGFGNLDFSEMETVIKILKKSIQEIETIPQRLD